MKANRPRQVSNLGTPTRRPAVPSKILPRRKILGLSAAPGVGSTAGSIVSVGGETVEPAGASGVDERLLAAPLAHMRRIPRHVLAARPVGVAEHRARTIRR